MKLSRGGRYGLSTLLFFTVWGTAYATLQSQPGAARDSAETLVEAARPVSAFESVLVGETAALPGELVFVEQRAQPNYRVARLDFAAPTVETVFTIPEGALVYQLGTGLTAGQMLMSYSAPSDGNHTAYDRNGIYTLDLSDGSVQRLLGEDAPDIFYAHPQPIDDAVVYTVYDRAGETRRVERFDPDMQITQVIATDAIMPLAASDGSAVAWLHINPVTQARSLWVSDADGHNPRELVSETAFGDLDLPLFSPDGAWIYFTALDSTPLTTTLLGALSGASPVSAHGNHNQPVRWYRVAVSGGTPEPITTDAMITLHATVQGESLGFVSDSGFQVAQAGTIRQIVRSRVMRSVVWLPG